MFMPRGASFESFGQDLAYLMEVAIFGDNDQQLDERESLREGKAQAGERVEWAQENPLFFLALGRRNTSRV